MNDKSLIKTTVPTLPCHRIEGRGRMSKPDPQLKEYNHISRRLTRSEYPAPAMVHRPPLQNKLNIYRSYAVDPLSGVIHTQQQPIHVHYTISPQLLRSAHSPSPR